MVSHSHSEPTNFQLSKPANGSLWRNTRIRMNKYRFAHSDNSPYISGDSIASLTDYYVYGRNLNQSLDEERLLKSNSVFVAGSRINRFLQEIRDLPLPELTLVTGNSDENFEDVISLPSEFKLWLCQNNGMPRNQHIYTLPIGLENLRLGRLGLKKWYKPSYQDAILNRVLVPPMSPTNQARFAALKFTKSNPLLFDLFTNYLHESEYFELTRKYKFVLCCEGNGFENHRIWETLYQGSFPVLIRTKWSESLEYLHLPILIVDSLESLTLELLLRHADINQRFNPELCPQLWTPFWGDFIRTRSLTLPSG